MALSFLGTRSAKAALAIVASFVMAVALSSPLLAEKVDNHTASGLLTQCVLADDSTDTMGPGLDAPNTDVCCSKELGYCVECPSDGKGLCEKFPVRGRFSLPGLKTTAPDAVVVAPNPVVRDHRSNAPKSQGSLSILDFVLVFQPKSNKIYKSFVTLGK